MSFELVPNLILILAVVGMLGMLLRRVPDVVEGQNQFNGIGSQPQVTASQTAQQIYAENILTPKRGWLVIIAEAFPQMLFSTLKFLKNVGTKLIKLVWKFMLEAKDLPKDFPHSGHVLISRVGHQVGKIIPGKSTDSSPKIVSAESAAPAASSELAGSKPAEFEQSFQKAKQLIENREYAQAEDIYMSMLKRHPHEYPAYEGLAQLYLIQKNYADAQETFEFLVRHNPNDDNFWAQLGNVLVKRRKFKQAIDAYGKSIELNPNVAARQFNLGSCYLALGNKEKARAHLQKAVDEEPQNVQYLERFNALSRVVTEVDKRS